jgi:hypothetical protein
MDSITIGKPNKKGMTKIVVVNEDDDFGEQVYVVTEEIAQVISFAKTLGAREAKRQIREALGVWR